jgi:ABC-2 type transport system ATP-binding protein
MAEPAVDARGLAKAFGPVSACRGVDLEVRPGEIMGLVGPDGAGKTTTFRMLCGIVPPDGGHAAVAGHDVIADPEGVKARIGYLPQRFSLHRDLTVDENIAYVAELYTVPQEDWHRRREELLDMTYLLPFRKRLAGRLSGGMRQKLALICTLIHRPEVLFLDEPTTGVDPVSRRDFWKLLYDLPRQGVTIVISTPYMDEAARCTRLAFMYAGQLLAVDTPAGLKQVVPGRLWQVRCRPQREAREALKRCPAVRGVEVFGDRLHVALQEGGTPDLCQEALRAAGIECFEHQPVEPSLEDAFMALVAAHGLQATAAAGNGG